MPTGTEVVPRVGVGTLQSEDRKEGVLEWTPVPGRVSCLEGHWGFLSAEGTFHTNQWFHAPGLNRDTEPGSGTSYGTTNKSSSALSLSVLPVRTRGDG